MDRDLSRHDIWEDSLARSRARREATATSKGGGFELPARGLSVAALVAVTGGTVASVGVANVVGGGGDDGSSSGASGSGARPAAVAKAPEHKAAKPGGNGGAEQLAQAPAVSRANAAQVTSTGIGASAGAQQAHIEQPKAEAAQNTLQAGHVGATAAAASVAPGAATATAGTAPAAADGTDGTAPVAGGQDGSAQGGSGQDDGGQGGSGQDGSSQGGSGEGGGGQDGTAQDGSGQGGSGQDGSSQGGGQDGSGQGGSSQGGSGQDGSSQSGSGAQGGDHADKPAGGVPELQQAIGVAVDGDFGPHTERALKRWQRSHGLTPDGIAGPQTREALDIGEGKVLKPEKPKHEHHADAPKRQPSTESAPAGGEQGSGQASGGGVKALQQALGVGADGVFGPGTQRALKQWQRAHGLTADGVAGPQTRQALGLGAGKVLKRRGGGHRSLGGSGGGDASGSVVARVVAAGNAIAGTPYVWGGGHGSFQASGYDCSGSVSYALHGGGLLDTPLDSTGLESYGLPGPGQHITIYANPGHAYMVIDGRRFDTSARSETGSRWTNTQRSSAGYVVRHPRGL